MTRVLALLVLCAASAFAQTDMVEVIPLRYRTADQVIPMLRPMVEPGGALTGMNNSLVIRSSARNIEQIRQVLATIDAMPRRLLISVRQDAGGSFEQRSAGISGTVAGSNGGVSVNEPPARESGVSARIQESRGTITDNVAQQVQALEGSPATIFFGSSRPITSTTVTPSRSGYSGTVQSTTTIQNLATGFQVIPRVSGDRVFLDIAPQRETPGPYGTASTQRIVTTASGRLGEWFELGGISQSSVSQQSGILSGSSGARSDTRGVWVKVDEIR